MTFIRSFLIAGIVAVLFGFGLKNVFGFWEGLTLAFVLQFVIAFVYTSLKISKTTALTAEFENELEQFMDFSEVSISCPCGNYTYTDNIFLNIDNRFTCEKCNNEFRIDISLTPTLVTTPLNVGHNFEKNIEREPTDDISITQEYTKGTEL